MEGTLARFGFLDDPAGRARRGRRIVALLRDCAGVSLAGLRVLDVGCSAGLITREVAGHAAFTVGADVATDAIAYAATTVARDGVLAFIRANAQHLPFRSASFDVVLCNHVYEHVDDAASLMAEIDRVLRPGGVCWFAAGHTFQLIEPHYRLPLLSMLPRRWADALLRRSGRANTYDIRFLPPWRVRSLLHVIGIPRLASATALRDPARYELATGALRWPLLRTLMRPVATPVAWLAPTHLWIVAKPATPGARATPPSATAARG
jgi:SAM-dependent methyltransferase